MNTTELLWKHQNWFLTESTDSANFAESACYAFSPESSESIKIGFRRRIHPNSRIEFLCNRYACRIAESDFHCDVEICNRIAESLFPAARVHEVAVCLSLLAEIPGPNYNVPRQVSEKLLFRQRVLAEAVWGPWGLPGSLVELLWSNNSWLTLAWCRLHGPSLESEYGIISCVRACIHACMRVLLIRACVFDVHACIMHVCMRHVKFLLFLNCK